jgi:dCMP deaminase
MSRPSKIKYYLNIAAEVAKRGTCQRRRFGAVIVRQDQIISTGYVGAPRGAKNCIEMDVCPRTKLNIPSGQRYELCRSVHAEANAIINAARAGVSLLGGIMYLYGENSDGSLIKDLRPCQMCRRMIINAGLERVILLDKEGIKEFNPSDWLVEELDLQQKGY